MCNSIAQNPETVKMLGSKNVVQIGVDDLVKLGHGKIHLSAHAMLLAMKGKIAVLMLQTLAVNVSLSL